MIRHHNTDVPADPQYRERLARIEQLKAKQKVYFNDDFMPVYNAGKHISHLKLGYAPLSRMNGANTADAYPNYEFAPGGAESPLNIEVAAYRNYTRNRVVMGPVPFYRNKQFGAAPTVMNTITACGVNLMGSSGADVGNFVENRQLIDVEAYKNAYETTARLIIEACYDNDVKTLVMPAFGVGAYGRALDDESAKLASMIVAQTFADVAKEHGVDVKWVVFSGDEQAHDKQHLHKAYLESIKGDRSNIEFIIGDIMEETAKLQQLGVSCALLNPGSDRTVGGHFESPSDRIPLEEKISQSSDLLALHSDCLILS